MIASEQIECSITKCKQQWFNIRSWCVQKTRISAKSPYSWPDQTVPAPITHHNLSPSTSRRDLEIERPIVGLNEDTVNTLT